MSKIEGNSNGNVTGQDGMENTFTSVGSIDEDNNCLEKCDKMPKMNDATSQMLSNRKKLAEKKFQIFNGNKKASFIRVIHFEESVRVYIPKRAFNYIILISSNT
ncbi:unnamed protein product [Wuchereria bancrofti]|uniref:Uncharacterized protein n=1 Tax=Wuchereria bancrofti TaxID=6293 RepID=A0A3P7DS28_WUCBA|nr:unnamed protein product [Wuchereria bancrofti]